MKAIKCEISNYQNRIWILFDDKRKVKVGDRVIKNGLIERVNIVYNTFELQGFYGTTGTAEAIGGNPCIVAAIESEISPSDLEKVKTQQSCFVCEVDGELILKDGFIFLTFENKY
jgi:hypothetical protein